MTRLRKQWVVMFDAAAHGSEVANAAGRMGGWRVGQGLKCWCYHAPWQGGLMEGCEDGWEMWARRRVEAFNKRGW